MDPFFYRKSSDQDQIFGSGEDIEPVEEHYGEGLEEADSAKMGGDVHKGHRAAINGNGLRAMDSRNRVFLRKLGKREATGFGSTTMPETDRVKQQEEGAQISNSNVSRKVEIRKGGFDD